MTLDTFIAFLVWWCVLDFLWWENWFLITPRNLGFCCICSYTCLSPSDYLKCSLPSLYLIRACPSCNPSWVRTPQSLSLWFWDPGILRFWVCQSSWESSCLWDPEILVWPNSWDPEMLWFCDPEPVRTYGSGASFGCCGTGWGVCQILSFYLCR